MRSEDVVSPTIQSCIFSCKNTDWVDKWRACEGACHEIVIEVMGMSIYVRIPFKYAACFGFRFTGPNSSSLKFLISGGPTHGTARPPLLAPRVP